MPLHPAFDTAESAWFEATSQLFNGAVAPAMAPQHVSRHELDEQTLQHVQSICNPGHVATPQTPLQALPGGYGHGAYGTPASVVPTYSPALHAGDTSFEALMRAYPLPNQPHTPMHVAFPDATLTLQHPSPLRAVADPRSLMTPGVQQVRSAPATADSAAFGTPASSYFGNLSPTPALTHCSTVQSTPVQTTPHHRSLSSCSSFSSLSLPPSQAALAAGGSRAGSSGRGQSLQPLSAAVGGRAKRQFFCSDKMCDRSRKSFLSNADLQRHINSHEGLKPFICEVAGCEKRYGQNYRLITHYMRHHPEINVDEKKSRASSTRAQVMARRRTGDIGVSGSLPGSRDSSVGSLSADGSTYDSSGYFASSSAVQLGAPSATVPNPAYQHAGLIQPPILAPPALKRRRTVPYPPPLSLALAQQQYTMPPNFAHDYSQSG